MNFNQYTGGMFGGYPMYQPNTQYSQPQQYQQQLGVGLNTVSNPDEIGSFHTDRNSVVPFFNEDGKTMYLKITDETGFYRIKPFKLTPIETDEAGTEYVTRAEFEQLKELIGNEQSLFRPDSK